VATESGETIRDSLQNPALKPDLKLADVRVSDYVGIIMPCMGSIILYETATPAEISLVKEAVFQGKPIAAQHGAVHILVQAGVLEGKKYSFRFEGVIQDGTIITSSFCPAITKRFGDPDGTPELTKLFIETIKD
jgi:putative intracellular protease/amidase